MPRWKNAELILNLRKDEKKGRFLTATTRSLEAQQSWLRAYDASTGQGYLSFEQAHFDVRAANEKVWKFHERFGAKLLRQVGDDFFYELSIDSIQSSIERYKRFLPHGITVLSTKKS